MWTIVDLETVAIDDADQYLELVSAPANYKDPEKIAEYVREAEARQRERCSLDPDLCRIVAMGWWHEGEMVPTVRLCDVRERDVLEQFWREARQSRLVTFNGLKFDLPVLMRRSDYLHVEHPTLNLDRYRTPHVDIWQKLTFNGVLPGHSLKFYLSRFGIVNDDLTTGKDIAQLVREGKWDEVRAHCRADVVGLRELALRLGYLTRAEIGAPF